MFLWLGITGVFRATQKRLTNKTLNPELKYNDVKHACHHGGGKGERHNQLSS